MKSNGYIVTMNKEQVREIDYTINKSSKSVKNIIMKADNKDIETRLCLESIVDTIICEPLISNLRIFKDILTSDSIITILSQNTSANLIVRSELAEVFKENPGKKKEGTSIYGKENKVSYIINNNTYNLITRVAHANQKISINMNRNSIRQSSIDINNTLYKVISRYYSIYRDDLDLLINNRFRNEIAINENYEYWNLKQLREIVDSELLQKPKPSRHKNQNVKYGNTVMSIYHLDLHTPA